MTLETGSLIAGYRVESLVGSGSSGSVYTAEDAGLGRRIALKILSPDLARDERFRERFLRESRVAAGLEHPNVIPIHAAGETEDGQLYLAMRYVEGRDLAALLRSLGRLDPERALGIVDQVASALDAAHAQGLVHRDVKPANILIAKHGDDEHVYLCDFGLAKHASTVSSLTGDRAVVGTVDYLAPEQIASKPVDGRIDVYGLGCVLYECLTGEPPFRRDNELASLLAHVNDPPPKPSERIADLSEAFDDVIAVALAKDREDRYATAGELATAARTALAGQTPTAPAPAARTAAVRTFLFADVRGYTAYTREHGDEAGAALAERFASIVRELAPDFEGHLQELRGDEALVVFDSARQALRFALALDGWASELERPIGIGLDAGEAVPVEEGFRGGALNRAARLCGLAKPGEVLASDAVVELAGAVEGVAYGFHRVERVKGFEKPVRVVEIHAPESAPRRELGRAVQAQLLGSRPGRRLLVVGGVAAFAVVAVAGLARVLGGPAALPGPRSVAVLDATSGTVRESIDADGEFPVMLAGDGVLYGLDFDAGLVARLDVATGTITDRFALPDVAYEYIAPDRKRGSWWVADGAGPRVLRIDPDRPSSPIRIPLPSEEDPERDYGTAGVAVTSSGVWATYAKPARVARIDPSTNRVVTSRDLEGADLFTPVMLASDGEELWAVQRNGKRLWRLDPRSGAVLASGSLAEDWVEDATVKSGYLWVAQQTAGGVWKVDGRGTTLGKVETGARPWAVVPSKDALWVPNANDGTVTRIDPETDRAETFDVGHRPTGLAIADDGRVWVSLALSASDALEHIRGKRVITAAVIGNAIGTTDPGAGGNEDMLLLQQATGARLMNYSVASDGHAEILPEVAAGLPTVSADSLTYTYRVRRGFRFSPPLEEEVTAATFRASIERAREQAQYCEYVLGAIKTITTRRDRIIFTLDQPRGDLSARLATSCASAVPTGTPHERDGVFHPIPSAGPYYPDSHIDGQQVVLLRNPNYGGKRPQNVDAIVFALGYSSDDAALAVDRGDADYVVGDDNATGVLGPEGELAAKYGPTAQGDQRWFSEPRAAIRFLIPDWTKGALSDARVRRAVSLALDRRALADVWNGTPQATIIPPGVPGYTPGGLGSPDPLRARKLLAGRRLTLDLIVPEEPELVRTADIVRTNLARVGITVRVRTTSSSDNVVIAQDPKAGIDLLPLGWYMDFADPANAVVDLVHPRGADQLFPVLTEATPTPPWSRPIEQAARVTGRGRAQAFAVLDRRLAKEDVPLIVYTTVGGRPVFLSERVGCHTFLPMFGGLPDLTSLCLKDQG